MSTILQISLIVNISVLVLFFLKTGFLYEVDLLNTATATSNLDGWIIKTYLNGLETNSSGWEELSFTQDNSTKRGYQICPDTHQTTILQKKQSWLRSPLIFVQDVSRIYIEMKFWMRECHDLEDTVCRETFKVYYHYVKGLLSSNSSFNKQYYNSLDTIAAESKFHPDDNPRNYKINREVISLTISERISHSQESVSIYFAIVDEGACMALTSVRVYYKICPEIVKDLAYFPNTSTGPHDTSLVSAPGKCVENSIIIRSHFDLNQSFPLYHCTSFGSWLVRTGFCACSPGYEADSLHLSCNKCPFNTYKSALGNEPCSSCPADTYTADIGATHCQCLNLDIPQQSLNISQDCSYCATLPSPPQNLSINEVHSHGSISLNWQPPVNGGKCKEVSYCVLCQSCSYFHSTNHDESFNFSDSQPSVFSNENSSLPRCKFSNFNNCFGLSYFPQRCENFHTSIKINNLKTRTQYRFTIIAVNAVTKRDFPQYFLWSKHSDNMVFHNNATDNLNEELLPHQLRQLLSASASRVLYICKSHSPSEITELHVIGFRGSALVSWSPSFYMDEIPISYQIRWQCVDFIGKNRNLNITYQADQYLTMIVNKTSATLPDLASGSSYMISVRTFNAAGFGNYSKPLYFDMPFSNTNNNSTSVQGSPYVVYVVSSVLVTVSVISAICVWLRCFKRKITCVKSASLSYTETARSEEAICITPSASSNAYRTYVDPFHIRPSQAEFECETDPDHVTTMSVIGCGEFGEVYRGTLIKKDTTGCGNDVIIDVAVKQLHPQCEPHEQFDFLREATALARFRHLNIVTLEGVVTKSRPYMIVTELMKHGSLSAFLKRHGQAGLAFPSLILVQMLKGVAMGMEYLGKLGYVHRDLAARNVLINDDLVCKVADFGLTRHLDEYVECLEDAEIVSTVQSGKIAIRWTSPEAVAYRSYSQASDIWSFGVLAWEVTTYGEKPYWNLTNSQVIEAINDGFRLPAPEDCPAILHQLMLECWHYDRHARPLFSQVITKLNDVINCPKMLEKLADPASTGVINATASPTSNCASSPALQFGDQENFASRKLEIDFNSLNDSDFAEATVTLESSAFANEYTFASELSSSSNPKFSELLTLSDQSEDEQTEANLLLNRASGQILFSSNKSDIAIYSKSLKLQQTSSKESELS